MFGVNLALRWPFYIAIVSAGIGCNGCFHPECESNCSGNRWLHRLPSINPTTGAGWVPFGCLILTTVIAFVASFIWARGSRLAT